MVDIQNSKIVIAVGRDMAYFCYYLSDNKVSIYENNLLSIFYLENENCYIILADISVNYIEFIDKIVPIINLYKITNSIHLVFSFGSSNQISKIFKYINDETKSYNIVYSLGMIAGEIYDNGYVSSIDSNLFKGVITSTVNDTIFYEKYSNKNLINYLYSLIYFYNKAGYFMGVEDTSIISDNSRISKIFYYSKPSNYRKKYIDIIQENIPNKFLYNKKWNNNIKYLSKFVDDKMSHFTTSFFDYTTCMFNIIIETDVLYKFMTEKTLKSIISNTPTFLVINDTVYQSLKDEGFWFLNEEFNGNSINEKLINFCNYIAKCDDSDFKKLYEITFKKSMNNRNLLYEYIYSHKTKELNYLLDI
jgi:hypothetical protein